MHGITPTDGQIADLKARVEIAARKSEVSQDELQSVIEHPNLLSRLMGLFRELGGARVKPSVPTDTSQAPFFNRQNINWLWRWGLFSTLLVALLCGIYYSITGSVPVVEKIIWLKWGEGSYLTLPFPLSRWLDVLFAPIWAIWMCIVFFGALGEDHEGGDWSDWVAHLVPILSVGLLTGLFIGVLSSSLIIILITSLVISLAVGRMSSPGSGLVWGLSTILGFSLIISLGVGLVIGLVFSLIYGTLFFFRFSS